MNALKSNKFLLLQLLNCRSQLTIATGRDDDYSMHRLLTAICELNRSLFTNIFNGTFTKGEIMKLLNSTALVLLFSEEHPDGAVITNTQYRQLVRRMTPTDRATHYTVELDASMKDMVEDAITDCAESASDIIELSKRNKLA